MKEVCEILSDIESKINNSNVVRLKINWDNPNGLVFGKLTAIRLLRRGSGDNRVAIIECRCDCGNLTEVRSCNLTSGNSTSCGCSTDNARSWVGLANRTHGMSYSTEYTIWHGMKNRCTNKKDPKYHRYGGRGITVCERWMNSFENFFADMGPKPSSHHSIDRIDNDGNYEPANCQWSIAIVQANNRSNNVTLQIGGLKLTVSQCARIYGVSSNSILYKKRKLGLSDRDAIFKQN